MANTIFWGLGTATLLTLFIIPCVYTIIIDDLGKWPQKREQGLISEEESI
jgi:Cu/Ag efflux pump CusA